jgi:hypothetical protein
LNVVTDSGGRKLEEVIPAGIGINYNITVDYTRFGFDDPVQFYKYLSSNIFNSIKAGKFQTNLHNYMEEFGVHIMPTVETTDLDLITLLNFVYIGTDIRTDPPTSEPTVGGPTNSPTPIPAVTFRYFEIVAGIVITTFLFGIYYIVSVATGFLRPRSKYDLNSKLDKTVGLVELQNRKDTDITISVNSSVKSFDFLPVVDENDYPDFDNA